MTFPTRPAFPAGLRLSGEGLVLREWTGDDLAAMVELFDEPEVAHRTPLTTPFDLPAAHDYLAGMRDSRTADQRINLAITVDGGRPMGEVLLIRTDRYPLVANIGYSVGVAHRGQRLAARSARVMSAFARDEMRLVRVQLQIEPDNAASNAAARASGFARTQDLPIVVEEKGRRFSLLTWALDLA